MTFNVINTKHRDQNEVWLHLQSNGEPAYKDDKKKQPIRVKFKSIHGEAFRKEFLKMNVKLSRIKEGKKKEYEKLAKEKAELSVDDVETDLINTFVLSEEIFINMVCELAMDWEGFVDQDGKDLEFHVDYFRAFISSIENYQVLTQIRDAFSDSENFMLA